MAGQTVDFTTSFVKTPECSESKSFIDFDSILSGIRCSESKHHSRHWVNWLTHIYLLLNTVTPDAFCSTPRIPCSPLPGAIPGLQPVCMNLYSSCSNPDIRQSYGSVSHSLIALTLILAFYPILYLCLTHCFIVFDPPVAYPSAQAIYGAATARLWNKIPNLHFLPLH